ncbi:MAG: alpha/beta hydrolase [Chloroflexota bacterium]|nr:alpha/beta hydrolase [Chloroflexota bacterium]
MKLVFIHGAGNSSLSFYYQLRHFRNSKAIDLPGHPDGLPCNSIDGYLEWVRGFIKARRYKDVVLCGHSMGGAIAQMYALRYPEELNGLILIGTGAKLKVDPNYITDLKNTDDSLNEWVDSQRGFFSGVEPDLYQLLVQRAAQIGPDVGLNDLLCCDRFDVLSEISRINLPTEIIAGSIDRFTPVRFSDYLANNISGSEEYIVEGGDHFLQLQHHKEVNSRIERFLQRIQS